MKKLLRLSFVCWFFTINPLLSQEVIIKHEPRLSDFSNNMYLSFSKENYDLVLDENEKKIYSKTPSINSNYQNVTDNIDEITVTITPVNNSPFPDVIIFYNETGFYEPIFFGNTINIPAGVYDVYFQFSSNSNNYDYIVINEQVGVTEDTTIEADMNIAVNYINMKLYDENGTLLEPGIFDSDNGTVIGGNATVTTDRSIFFDPGNLSITLSMLIWDAKYSENEDSKSSFYINDLSSRYSIVNNAIAFGYENGLYFNKYETLNGISDSGTIENNFDQYVYHQQDFKSSNLGDSEGVKLLGFTTFELLNEFPIFGITNYNQHNIFNTDVKFEAYLNTPLDSDINSFLVYPAIIDYIPSGGSFSGQGFFTIGNAIYKNGNNISFGSHSASTNAYFLNDFTYISNSSLKIMPFHPRFSFSSTEVIDLIIGDNVPISVAAFVGNSLMLNYLGRYGEKRDSDFFGTEVEIKQNDNVIFSGNYVNDDFWNYIFPETGNYEVVFCNFNSNVDDIESKNITKLIFNRNANDSTPPTLQQLQFRDLNGNVTDKFESSSEGFIRMSAGDFELLINENYDYSYVPGNTVELYYSLYDQENWTEIELIEYPEYFQMPAFGDYYEASLADVVVPENNMWFDVKVICTDAAGNQQEQVISPAFKVEQSNMGTNEVNLSGLVVYPNPFTNEINIKLPESIKGNYNFKVSDLTGKTIYSKNQNDKAFIWNGSSLPKGIYILSIENNGKIIAEKVIKK